MKFKTIERCRRTYVIKNGVESVSFTEQKPSGTWAIMKPYTQCLGTLEETLAMIAADMDTWYTASQAAARLVEMGVFDEPPSAQRMTKWCRGGLLPGAFKLLGRGARGSGGSWRIPEAALRAFAERRKEQ